MVVRRDAVGRHEQQVLVVDAVQLANLAAGQMAVVGQSGRIGSAYRAPSTHMTSRFVPYATTPGRLLGQLISDIVIAVWVLIWLFVGMAVHSAVATIAQVGRQVEDGANGIADNLESAGEQTNDVPLLGNALRGPLKAAGDAALDIASAGHNLDNTASWLAWVLALAVAAPRSWPSRCRGCSCGCGSCGASGRRSRWPPPRGSAAAGDAGAGQPAAGQTRQRRRRPRRAWRNQDVAAIRGLAALELRAAGIARRL